MYTAVAGNSNQNFGGMYLRGQGSQSETLMYDQLGETFQRS